MMIFQLSLFATLGVVILLSSQCASQATLMQKSTEVKLDGSDSMELVCSVTGSVSGSRVWTGGPGFQPLITNGISTDSSKYTETVQTVEFSLHVHNVIVDDVCGVDFMCTNGFFDSPQVTIVLNSSIFRYVPIPSDIQVLNKVYDDMKMTILVNLTTVFPEPTCNAELGTIDITSKLQSNSYNNGNCGLKSTELRINNETYHCPAGQLVITCMVGSQSITAYRGSLPCPTVTTEMASTSTSQDQIISSQNPYNAPFHNIGTQETETTIKTTTDNELTSVSQHASSEVTTSLKTASDTRRSQDQTTSSQNPFVDSFPNTEKTETTITIATENDLTSAFLHVSSEVTSPIKTESDNLTDLGVSVIIAFAISGFIFLSLIIILIICCCQYYRKKSRKKTSENGEEFQEIHDNVDPKFWPNFNSHRYGFNEINGSTVHLPRGYNIYQGEHNRGYNLRSKHHSDNYNRSRSDRKIITENRKHKQKQVQENISHSFPHSIPDDIMNRHDHNDINGINTYDLHDNNQNTRTYYRGNAVSSPRRFEYRGTFLPHEYINHNRRSSPYMTYLQEHVPRDLEGLTFYQGYNGATNNRSRRYY